MIDYKDLVVGYIYYGTCIQDDFTGFFKYLGNGKWTRGIENLNKLVDLIEDNTLLSYNTNAIQVISTAGEQLTINKIDGFLNKSKPKTKYKVINAPRTDNNQAIYREF